MERRYTLSMENALIAAYEEFQAITARYIEALRVTNHAARVAAVNPSPESRQAWIGALEKETQTAESRVVVLEKLKQAQIAVDASIPGLM